MKSNLSISVYSGEGCTYEGGCYIKILGPDTDWQRFTEANNYYFLADGDAIITYASNNTEHTISSKYTSGWSDCLDTWDYSTEFKMRVTKSTRFVAVKAKDESTNNDVGLIVKFGKAENETISIDANANSMLMVYGKDFFYNNNAAANIANVKMHHYRISTPQSISINATSKCICVLVEEA